MPSVINIGECLVGGTKIGKFLVRNDGGDGKFCFLLKEKWPVANFKVIEILMVLLQSRVEYLHGNIINSVCLLSDMQHCLWV